MASHSDEPARRAIAASTRIWFRARREAEGTGYGIASNEGLLVTILFVALVTLSAILPPLLAGGSYASFGSAALLCAAEIAAFVWIIRTHSDWNG